MYTCKFCGREFEKNSAHTQHEKYYCKLNPNKQESKSHVTYTQHHKAKCKYCGKEVDVACIKKHEKACGDPNSKLNTKKLSVSVNHDDLCCIYCGKEHLTKTSLAQHEIRCPKNPNRKAYNTLAEYSRKYIKGQTKETSEVVAKYAATTSKLYAEGKLEKRPFSFVNDVSEYKHSEHNKEEILKWFSYLDSNTFDIPQYDTVPHNEGYNVVSKLYTVSGNTVKLYFEHAFLMNIALGGKLSEGNTVHHINRIKNDNSLHNLMVFDTSASHKRYHSSKNSYLTYDENTHLFHCDLKDMC